MEKLTDIEFWDDYWLKYQLPLEMKKSNDNPYLSEILKIFDRYLPANENLTVLEIGGSPGQYLAYLHRTHGYHVNCLDYSPIGCQKTKENFALLNIKGEVYEADLFSENSNIPKFDIVYSLGLIEHFSDLNLVIEKHLNFLKPGGILMIGAPNFLGINHYFLKRLAPELLSKHNLNNMDIDTWSQFEKKFQLEILYKGYVGGFHPSIFNRREKKTIFSLFLSIIVKLLVFTFKKHFRKLRQFNSKYFSGYMVGFYMKGTSKSRS